MSFVIAEPDFVTAAAGQLAGIRSSIGAAAEAAAAPTTGIAHAAADEISAAISRLFGAYGQEFQAVNSQAAAFHAEFVRLLNGSAAAYLSADIANAEQTLLSGAVGFPTAAPTDPLGGLLGGLLGGGTTGGGGLLGPLTGGTGGLNLGGVNFVLPSLPSLLSPNTLNSALGSLSGATGQLGPILGSIGTSVQNLLFPQLVAGPGVVAAPNPYQVLFENTVRNLSDLGANYRPFPILSQIAVNQAHYAQLAGNALALNLQGFPGNVQANIQLGLQEAAQFNPAVGAQAFINGTTGFYGTLGTQLAKFGEGIQQTFPTFQRDLNLAGMAVQQGQYPQAVQYGARSLVDLFITGFDTSGLGITVDVNLPPSVVISGPIGVEGPAGALLPILSAIGQQAQGAASLIPAGSIPGMMAQNFANGINTLTNAGVSADFALTLGLPPTLTGEAIFGLPLQLGFAILGPPFAGLNGLAQGATAFSTSMAAGNLWGAANAIGNTPAFILDGFLNGEVLLDQPLPVTLTLLGLPVTIPVTAHLPFTGLLVPPHGITATAELSQLLPIPGLPDITVPLGGTKFGGIFPFLLNTLPQQIAQSMAYTNTAA